MQQRRMIILLSLFTLLLFLLKPGAVAAGVQNALRICGGAIIPSLFVYAVMSGILVRVLRLDSGKRQRPPLLLFLLGALCGFPIGAQLCRDLYAGDEKVYPNAEWLAATVDLASPAFVIGAVGCGGFGSQKIGICIYLCQTIIAFIGYCLIRVDGQGSPKQKSVTMSSFGEILFASVESAVRAILNVCGLLCLFSALLSVLSDLPFISQRMILPLAVLLEIGNGTALCAKLFAYSPALSVGLTAFCCGFSGICVQLQISTAMKGFHLNSQKLLLYKLIMGILCAAASIFCCKILGCY
ncbi:MAG: hypothetical protein IJU41_01480 [Clostridia bacterium]|nr:hypothetical protein [Clostridia bacterium]